MPGAGRIRRTGDVVRRPLGFWSPAVHHLLGYLQDAGFPAPRVLGTEDRDELLTWIDGESGPLGWSKIVPEAGLRRWASFLRQYHDTVAGYRPPPGSIWSASLVREPAAGPGDIVGRVAEQQRLVLERCAALGRRGIEPQATWVREGYLGTVRARIRWTEALRL